MTEYKSINEMLEQRKKEIEERRKKEKEEFRRKYMNKKMYVLYILGFIIITSVLQVHVAIPAYVKVYINEEYDEFISPPCVNFDIGNNDMEYEENLRVGTYSEAVEGGYFADSTCTDETVHPQQSILKYYVMNKIFGVAEDPLSRWNENGDWKW